jgi:predicted amidohydrolase YtcJ
MSEKLFVNGKIYTLNPEQPLVAEVYVKDGKITDIGQAGELRAQYPSVETVDLQGKVMTPGLTDSHMHLIAHGQKLLSLDFSDCYHLDEVRRRLKERIDQTASGEWVLGRGWNENQLAERRMLVLQELDELSTEHPILLTRICGHAFLANSVALKLAGIEQHTPDPAGGKIVRDGETLTGLLLENAGLIVQQHVPEESVASLKEALRTAIKDCWSQGLVGCHTEDVRYCGGFRQTLKIYDEVIHQEGYKFRTNHLIYFEQIDEMIADGKAYGDGSEYVDIGAMKIFADGAMGGRSALLSEPYSDDPSTSGVAIHSQQELNALVAKARKHGLPVAVHTIGDLALEMTLNAIEEHPVRSGLRDRIIHAQVLTPELLERMKKLPIIVDIQPRFVAADFPWVIDRLGQQRVKWSYAWKTMLKAGLLLAGGSDAPIEPVSPLLGIHAAMTRRAPDQREHEGYCPEQKLSAEDSLALFTIGSAVAEQKLALKGTIEKGKYADFTVFETDVFHVGVDEWLEKGVVMTVIDGEIVYRKTTVLRNT